MIDIATERSVTAQLSTARWLLAQFEAQLNELAGMNREARRTARGRELVARRQGLKDGREKWAARANDLEARAGDER